MSRSVTCYPIPGKPKALLLCEAFAAGVVAAGGEAHVCRRIPSKLEPGAAVFYGVRPSVAHLWAQAKAERRDWYYIDNSLFDCARERQFRVAKNRIQPTGVGESDGKRFAALGITIKPMREGANILVCAQSQEFMEVVAGDPGWLQRVLGNLQERYGDPRVILRTKHEIRPLAADLARSGLLVTWSSAAAVTALLEGVRVMCAPECCATYADGRQRWASVLADNQWTVAEIARGDAWKALNAARVV